MAHVDKNAIIAEFFMENQYLPDFAEKINNLQEVGKFVQYVSKENYWKAYKLKNSELLRQQRKDVEALIDNFSQLPDSEKNDYKHRVRTYFKKALKTISQDGPRIHFDNTLLQ